MLGGVDRHRGEGNTNIPYPTSFTSLTIFIFVSLAASYFFFLLSFTSADQI